MPVIISTRGNSAIVSEKITSIHKKVNTETNKPIKAVEIIYDNGIIQTLTCRTMKERDELFNIIIEAMKITRYGK